MCDVYVSSLSADADALELCPPGRLISAYASIPTALIYLLDSAMPSGEMRYDMAVGRPGRAYLTKPSHLCTREGCGFSLLSYTPHAHVIWRFDLLISFSFSKWGVGGEAGRYRIITRNYHIGK